MAEQNYWFYGLLHTFWSQKPGILVWDVIFPLWKKKKKKQEEITLIYNLYF